MSTARMTELRGSCLCGGVTYEVRGPLDDVTFCHCTQCRKTSGHFDAATSCKPEDLHVVADDTLRWYASSDAADRGFCGTCGSSVFWRPKHGRHISIMAGTLERPTGLKGVEHIYVADKSDYYSIDDGLPQFAQDSE